MEGPAVAASVADAGDAAIGGAVTIVDAAGTIGALGTGVVRVLVGAVFIRAPAEPVTAARVAEGTDSYPE
jgi:hypothetical protein